MVWSNGFAVDRLTVVVGMIKYDEEVTYFANPRFLIRPKMIMRVRRLAVSLDRHGIVRAVQCESFSKKNNFSMSYF